MLAAARIQSLVARAPFRGFQAQSAIQRRGMGAALRSKASNMYQRRAWAARPASVASRNLAWRNAGFRGYADYMETPAYRETRERLVRLALQRPTAVMCAEAMWWQCHRSLIADDLKALGWEVIHLLSPGRAQEHPYTAAARIIDGRLDYTLPADHQPALF